MNSLSRPAPIPSNFRLIHLDDPRGRDVIEKAAQGFGCRRDGKRRRVADSASPSALQELAAYCAVASEVEVNRETGRRVWCARSRRSTASGGQSDGLINQIEGAIGSR